MKVYKLDTQMELYWLCGITLSSCGNLILIYVVYPTKSSVSSTGRLG